MVTILEQVENPDLAEWCVRLVFCGLLEGVGVWFGVAVECLTLSALFGVSPVVLNDVQSSCSSVGECWILFLFLAGIPVNCGGE